MGIRSIWQNTRIVPRGFDSISMLLVLATVITAASASTGRLKGCNRKCQKECLDVLNKYRKNHDAPKLQFSRELASKAQKWADGGKFGYDMNAQGKYGQLIEWDVKHKLPSFTAAIKYWHDKEKDYDFVRQKSKNGRNLHDFTQVVWKKAHKAGCGRGTLFGSRYYVVWMDADVVRSFNLKRRGNENVGAPRERDLHWFEITAMSAVGKPLYRNATNTTRSPKSFVFPQQEEEREDDNDEEENEELILNDSNNIKGYINSDSLTKLYDEENKEMFHLQDQLDGFGSPLENLLDNQQTSDEGELPEHNNTENTIEKVQEGHEPNNNMDVKGYLKSNDTKINSTKSRDGQGMVKWKQSLLENALDSMSNSSEQSTTPASQLSQNSTTIGHSLEIITPESAFSNFGTSSERQKSQTQIKAPKPMDNGREMNGSSLVLSKKLNASDSQGFKKTDHSLERINKETEFSSFGPSSKKQTPMETAPSSKSFKSGTTHSAPFPTLLKELHASQDTKTRKPFFVKSAKIRHKSKPSKEKPNPSPQVETSSIKHLQEMSGLILGRVSDNQQNSELDIFNKSISKDFNSNIVSDDNLRPDMQVELSKVAQLIDTKIKNLTKSKEPLSRSPNDKNNTKDKYNVAIRLEEKNNDDPNARPAKVWMPLGAPSNSTTNMTKNGHNDVQEIKNKVSELWKIHLKEKKQKKHPPQPAESDIYQDSGDDEEEESADNKEDDGDNDMVTVDDFNHLHGWQYDGFGQPIPSNTENNGPLPFQNTRPGMGGGWYGMQEVPYDNNNDFSQAANMQPGSYEFRKKYTGGEPEQGRVQKARKIFEKKNSKSFSQGQDATEHSKLEQLALESYKTPGRPLAYRNNKHGGMFIPKDYYKLLDLPKEIKLRKAKSTEKVSAQYLPEIMDDEEAFQNKHADENNDNQPGFFNEDFSHDHLTGSYEDDQNTVPSSSYKQQTPSHTKPVSLLTSSPNSHKQADSSKETILQNKMDEQFLSRPVKKVPGQRPERQPIFQDPHNMANGVGHQIHEGSKAQSQRPLSNKDAEIGMMKISSFEKHQQQKLSRSVSMGDGSLVKNPYQRPGVVITKGPFGYQTGTTMAMDGRKDDYSHFLKEGPGGNDHVQAVQQNVQHPSNQEQDKDESKQHEQGRKMPFSLNRPSLITLLKENDSQDRADEAKQRRKGNELVNNQHEGKSAKGEEKIFEKEKSESDDNLSKNKLQNTSESLTVEQSPSNVSAMSSSDTSSGLQGDRKPKPFVPFSKLLSRINLALGIDSPDSKMKVDRQNSTSKTPQPPRDDEFRNPNLIVDEPELINDIQTLFKNHQSQDDGFRRPHVPVDEPESKTSPKNPKHGQFWLNEGSPKEKLLHTNVSIMKTQTRLQKPLTTKPLESKDDKNDSSMYVEQHTGQRMQPEISLKMHLSCADTEERCSSWQQRGHCKDVKYADFMKRNCKRSCGYCAFPGVQLQSEKASQLNEASLKNDCQDLSTYEFSCPRWKAQGYCQRKEKSMRFACRRTCGFCKRKYTKKQKDSQSKVQTHPKTPTVSTSKYSEGNFAHAQTGAGKNVATAQTGNATNPQSTAYAQGGNTFVQTQSSSTQQSAYAVAYPAPSPQQQTYSHAQSSSKLGRQSNAYAQSGDQGKPANSKGQPQISASAQIGSAQKAYRGNDDSSTETQKITDKDVSIEDRKVMENSPEYLSRADSDSQYLVTTSDSEEAQQSYEVPEMRFPKGTKVSFLKRPKTGGENVEKPHQESQEQEGPESLQESLAEAANEVIDDDIAPNPQDNVMAMTDSLDSQEANSLSNLEKKGSVNPVSTKGCNSTCQKECLETINLYRKNHGSNPLKLSQTLAKHAQDWGDTKTYGHSPWARQGLGGELIAVGGFYKTFTAAVKAWHDEEKNIDWTTGKTMGVTNHFKQLVLKGAKFLGCGKTLINGEPYYIAQMDVAAAHDNTLKTTGKPKTPDLGWYSASSPYWKDLQGREAVPTRGQHRQPQNFIL